MMSAIPRHRNGVRMPLRIFTAVVIAAVLAACGNLPAHKQQAQPEQLTLAQISERLRTALPADRPRYQMDAADLLLRQRKPDQAAQWLHSVGAGTLTPAQHARYQELRARLALQRNAPQQALELLRDPQLLQAMDQLPAARQTALALVKAEALERSGQYLAAARERVFVDSLLNAQQRADNHKALWRALTALSPQALTQARSQTTENEDLRGWIDLALIARQYQGNPAAQASALAQWQRQWPHHPANGHLPADLTEVNRIAAEQPQRIALLLPLSGRLAAFGAAIRDGFMAAWYDARSRGGKVPQVRIYDTDANPNFIEVYQRAIADGAQAVIGPLEKPQVAALYQQVLPVPTLALNRADVAGTPPAQLYQFGLAPEDEAVELARLGAQRHFHRVLVIAPQEDRTSRELQTFVDHWQQAGGTVVAYALYDSQHSISRSIKEALDIPASEARKRQIESLLGRHVEFAPHRRDDIDMVLMMARPQQARSIMPTLNFYYAGDIPVYAFSRSYAGFDEPTQDRDIDGMRFTEMPWMLDPQQPLKRAIIADLPRSRSYLRLYALGVDGFYLYPRLRQLAAAPDSRVYGQTGYLTLSPERVVERELLLAQIQKGVARIALNTVGGELPAAGSDNTTTPGTERPDHAAMDSAQ